MCHLDGEIWMLKSHEIQDYAVLLWNHDSHKLVNYGASQREVRRFPAMGIGGDHRDQ
jgi:hypothetical protein